MTHLRATAAAARTWKVLCSSKHELALCNTLPNGQCFNWTELETGSTTGTRKWRGVLGSRVIDLKQQQVTREWPPYFSRTVTSATIVAAAPWLCLRSDAILRARACALHQLA
jgi:hypothetical protein